MATTLGTYLRYLRKNSPRRPIRLPDVLAELELPRQTVYKWEGASSRPDLVKLRQYCEYLGVTAQQWANVLELRSLPIGAQMEIADETSPDDSGPVCSAAS